VLPSHIALIPRSHFATLPNRLSYHVVPGVAATAGSLKDGQKLMTALKGGELTDGVEKSGAGVTIIGAGSKARVIKADVPVCHGVVHVVDEVLLPIKGRRGKAGSDPVESTVGSRG
jgi:uncharacterized surface protein with fasciclin (FAS1) repeats